MIMKSLLFASIFALGSVAMVNPVNDVVSLPVDTAASTVKWTGYKVTGKHWGTVNVKGGSLDFQNGVLKGGSFTIDMTSIAVDDLKGDTKGKLEGHLKSDDFFGVTSFPDAQFVITQAISRGTPGAYKIVGNITIKGKTKELRFNAQIDDSGANYVGNAEFKLDRSDFDVRYGSGSFFDNLGDATIYDEFDMAVTVAVKK
jgi:polyisoprenoid-binding protein YceI